MGDPWCGPRTARGAAQHRLEFTPKLDGGAAARTPARARALQIVSVVVNLGVLGYFKYGNFLSANLTAALHALGLAYHPAHTDIVLPIGISFYTFHTLSYTLDVYLGRTRPADSFLDFALYVTFFPALVAGPLLRASQFLPQCAAPRRTTGPGLAWGLTLMVLGLFEKMGLADSVLAPFADELFAGSGQGAVVDAWTGTLAFAGQVFCDFAGYSSCAVGAALCLGFTLPNNFRFPYAAVGFSEFWTRWHISLSTWLRDYLYIPLGGNRRGPTRTNINLVLTMLLGGLWHGASWTFVAWGALHGGYLIGERQLKRWLPGGGWRTRRAARLMAGAATFALVCIAWVLFRAASLSQAFAIAGSLVGLGGGDGSKFSALRRAIVGTTVFAIVAAHWALRDRSLEALAERTPWPVRAAALGAMVAGLFVMQGQDRAFIYFQF